MFSICWQTSCPFPDMAYLFDFSLFFGPFRFSGAASHSAAASPPFALAWFSRSKFASTF